MINLKLQYIIVTLRGKVASNYDHTQKLKIVTKPKTLNSDKTKKKSNIELTLKLKLGQNSKNQIVTKIQKIEKSKTQSFTKLSNSKCDKTENSN